MTRRIDYCSMTRLSVQITVEGHFFTESIKEKTFFHGHIGLNSYIYYFYLEMECFNGA